MYEKFINNCKIDNYAETSVSTVKDLPITLSALYGECGYCSFNKGLYRVYGEDVAMHWKGIIEEHFSEYKNRIYPFAFDWMGRQFAVDNSDLKVIIVFDPATAEVLKAETDLLIFHNSLLLNKDDDLLDEKRFLIVMKSLGLNGLPYNRCIGFKKSLFLGGIDAFENLEMVSVEVYWEMQLQIYAQIKLLPPGTKIDSIKFIPK